SMQVESARTAEKVQPFAALPESLTSFTAISTAVNIFGAMLSIGPVAPRRVPIFTSSADEAPAESATAEAARSSFFIGCLPGMDRDPEKEPNESVIKRKAT